MAVRLRVVNLHALVEVHDSEIVPVRVVLAIDGRLGPGLHLLRLVQLRFFVDACSRGSWPGRLLGLSWKLLVGDDGRAAYTGGLFLRELIRGGGLWFLLGVARLGLEWRRLLECLLPFVGITLLVLLRGHGLGLRLWWRRSCFLGLD